MCERCWIARNSEWKVIGDMGDEVLDSVRVPVRLNEPSLEQCAFCGYPTIFGVYVRQDPTTVSFPAVKTDG